MSPDPQTLDMQVRLAAMDFLRQSCLVHGETLPTDVLQKGFEFQGRRVPLINPAGIFKPAILDLPLTFRTAPLSLRRQPPYQDQVGLTGGLTYCYRGNNPDHPDNAGMREAMKRQVPLIYLYGTAPGRYEPVFPAYIVADDPRNLTFAVMADEATSLDLAQAVAREGAVEVRRRYATVEVQRRLHQHVFHDRVLEAYHERCAVCELRHRELLDAAHILKDSHPLGKPVIPNGLALCKLHHAAFDANIMGISPESVIDIREDILREHDGPMLRYGLQELKGHTLHVPHTAEFKPSRDLLAIRYEEFRKAG